MDPRVVPEERRLIEIQSSTDVIWSQGMSEGSKNVSPQIGRVRKRFTTVNISTFEGLLSGVRALVNLSDCAGCERHLSIHFKTDEATFSRMIPEKEGVSC